MNFYIYVTLFLSFIFDSNCEYRYLGVRSVNQVEPPSLESSDMAQSLECEAPLQAPNGETQWGEPPDALLQQQNIVPNTRMFMEAPQVRLIDRKKVQTPMREVNRINLPEQGVQLNQRQLKPNVKTRVETYTETYVVSTIRTRIRTRKRKFVQQRTMVNQKVNKPYMVIKRRTCNERQVFERIIPRVVETREVVNRPSVQSRIVEGPVVEVGVDGGGGGGGCLQQDMGVDMGDGWAGETVDGDAAVSNYRGNRAIGSYRGNNYIGRK